MTDAPKVCGTCRHWHRNKPSAVDLAPVNGECREGPPATTIVIGQQGGQIVPLGQMSQYGQLHRDFPACSRHSPVAPALSLTE